MFFVVVSEEPGLGVGLLGAQVSGAFVSHPALQSSSSSGFKALELPPQGPYPLRVSSDSRLNGSA